MDRKVVVIGGGHGQAAVCRSLKQLDGIEISAIVTVADDGGSTGRLRRIYNVPAIGDIRDVLISLAQSESMMKDLMDYRFLAPEGSCKDVGGHNLGNLILLALMETKGSLMAAIQAAGQVLNVKGRIIPATFETVTLCAAMNDGAVVQGQAHIPRHPGGIKKVFYSTPVKAAAEAVEAIKEADVVIYCLGSLYTSVLPNVIIDDIRAALQETKAKRIYVCNAMCQPGETEGYSLEDHVRALQEAGCDIDVCLACKDQIPLEILQRYAAQSASVVEAKEDVHPYEIVFAPLLKFDGGLIRHDSDRLAKALKELLEVA